MPLSNTPTSYGLVARILHWLTALVILAAIPVGLLANRLPYATDAEVARTFALFSTHKTLGIAALTLGLIRIGWSLAQPRPVPLHPDRKLETFLASVTHWTLSLGLILVPLAGWAAHSATPGLAPIWWPFGQDLPLVPQDETSGKTLGAIHRAFSRLLAAALVLHIAGALKHSVIDRDATLARMTTGASAGETRPVRHRFPLLAATALWTATLALAILFAPAPTLTAQPPVEWPVATAEATLLDDAGQVLGSTDAASLLLTLAPDNAAPDNGTLDITVPIDAMEGDGIDAALSQLIFPIVSFSGTVSGAPPDLQADGTFDSSGTTAQATFAIRTDATGARVTGTAPIPGTTLQLRLEATTTRP